jgi:hypothetical protein
LTNDDEPLNDEQIPVTTNKGSTRDPAPNPTKVRAPDVNQGTKAPPHSRGDMKPSSNNIAESEVV